jgi:hypothetical protein
VLSFFCISKTTGAKIFLCCSCPPDNHAPERRAALGDIFSSTFLENNRGYCVCIPIFKDLGWTGGGTLTLKIGKVYSARVPVMRAITKFYFECSAHIAIMSLQKRIVAMGSNLKIKAINAANTEFYEAINQNKRTIVHHALSLPADCELLQDTASYISEEKQFSNIGFVLVSTNGTIASEICMVSFTPSTFSPSEQSVHWIDCAVKWLVSKIKMSKQPTTSLLCVDKTNGAKQFSAKLCTLRNPPDIENKATKRMAANQANREALIAQLLNCAPGGRGTAYPAAL